MEHFPEGRVRRILSDSLFTSARPIYWDEYFNYASSPTFAKLERRFGCRLFPRLAFFTGPKGAGKTSAARICGMIASCNRILAHLKIEPDARGLRPCGICEACVAVQSSEAHENDNYRELNASHALFPDHLENALKARHYGGWRRDPHVPLTIAIDEAAGLSKDQWKMMHKEVEDVQGVCFIFVMRLTEKPQISEPMQDRMLNKEYEFQIPSLLDTVNGIRRLMSQLGLNIDVESARILANSGRSSMRGVLESLDDTRDLWPTITADAIRGRFRPLLEDSAVRNRGADEVDD